jgi:hypothetical protein
MASTCTPISRGSLPIAWLNFAPQIGKSAPRPYRHRCNSRPSTSTRSEGVFVAWQVAAKSLWARVTFETLIQSIHA